MVFKVALDTERVIKIKDFKVPLNSKGLRDTHTQRTSVSVYIYGVHTPRPHTFIWRDVS